MDTLGDHRGSRRRDRGHPLISPPDSTWVAASLIYPVMEFLTDARVVFRMCYFHKDVDFYDVVDPDPI